MWSDSALLNPGSVGEVLVTPDCTKQEALAWIKGRLDNTVGSQRALLLSGPSGCGKCTLVRTICRVLGVQCIEPETLSMGDVLDAVLENASTSKFSLSSEVPRPRVFLFSGIDGFMSASAETSDNAGAGDLTKLLSHLSFCGPGMPPIVFTVHDLEGKVGWKLRACPFMKILPCYRIDPTKYTDKYLAEGLARVLERVCYLSGHRNISSQVLNSFDGDIKQAILRTELAIRSRVTCQHTNKDMELTDGFESARLLMNKKDIAFDDMDGVYRKFHGTEIVLHSNYICANVDMMSNAYAADAWSVFDLSPHYSRFSAGVLVMSLRIARSKVPLPLSALKYERGPSLFNSFHATLSDYRNGSRNMEEYKTLKGRMEDLAKTRTFDAASTFAGSPHYFTMTDLDTWEVLHLLKLVFDADDDVATFHERYGVSPSYMASFLKSCQVEETSTVHSTATGVVSSGGDALYDYEHALENCGLLPGQQCPSSKAVTVRFASKKTAPVRKRALAGARWTTEEYMARVKEALREPL